MKIRLPCQVRAVLFSVIWLVEHSSAAICGGVERLWVDAGAGGDGRPYLCSTPSQHTAPSVERCASMEDERGKARRAARGGRKAAGPLHGAGSQGSPSPSLFLSLSSCLFLFITLALFLRVSLFLSPLPPLLTPTSFNFALYPSLSTLFSSTSLFSMSTPSSSYPFPPSPSLFLPLSPSPISPRPNLRARP